MSQDPNHSASSQGMGGHMDNGGSEIGRDRPGASDALSDKAGDDMEKTKDRGADRLSDAKESVSSSAESVGSKFATMAGSDTAVAQHPLGVMAGAMAGGALLGFITAGGADDHRNSSKRHSEAGDNGGERGLAGGIIGGLVASARGYAMGQASDVMHSVVDGVKSGASSRSADHGGGKASRVYTGERHLPPAEDEEDPQYGRDRTGIQEAMAETASALQRGGRG